MERIVAKVIKFSLIVGALVCLFFGYLTLNYWIKVYAIKSTIKEIDGVAAVDVRLMKNIGLQDRFFYADIRLKNGGYVSVEDFSIEGLTFGDFGSVTQLGDYEYKTTSQLLTPYGPPPPIHSGMGIGLYNILDEFSSRPIENLFDLIDNYEELHTRLIKYFPANECIYLKTRNGEFYVNRFPVSQEPTSCPDTFKERN